MSLPAFLQPLLGEPRDMPRPIRESWRYTDLRPLAKINFSAAPLDVPLVAGDVPRLLALDAPTYKLVLVNGLLRPDLSDLRQMPADLQCQQVGSVLHIRLTPRSCIMPAVLKIVHVLTQAPQPQNAHCAIHISLGAHARLTVLEHYAHVGNSAAENAVPQLYTQQLEIDLAQQSKLVHTRCQRFAPNVHFISKLNAELAAHAVYDNFSLLLGAALTRNEMAIRLGGVDAQTQLNGAYLMQGTQHADTTSFIDHAAPHTSSREVYRGVLSAQSRGVFQGKIRVQPQAQQTDGYQLNRALLLSPTAEINSKPELEIYADAVKCSHGATVGDLDAAQIFYLRQRGLSLPQARNLLVRAYVQESLNDIHDTPLRHTLEQEVEQWLSAQAQL